MICLFFPLYLKKIIKISGELTSQKLVKSQMLLLMIKALILLWVTTNSHPLSISLGTPELIEGEQERAHKGTTLHSPPTFSSSLFPFHPHEATLFWCLHWTITTGKFCTKERPAGHPPKLLSAQSAKGDEGIFSLHCSPSSLTSHVNLCVYFTHVLQDHLSTPHTPSIWLHNNKHKVQPQLLTMLAVPCIRQCNSSLWFIPVATRNKYSAFALFSFQQVTQSIMAGWSQSPYRNSD